MLQIASLFGVGFLPKAPGTFGSIFAVLIAYILMLFIGFPLFVLITIFIFFLGWRATIKVQKEHNEEDPSWVVIDEVVGQFIALFPVAYSIWSFGFSNPLILWPGILSAFIFFRLFDIKKPNLVGWADRRGDALGVMLDDVIAGIYAAIVVIILGGVYHVLIQPAIS